MFRFDARHVRKGATLIPQEFAMRGGSGKDNLSPIQVTLNPLVLTGSSEHLALKSFACLDADSEK